jgi:predicted RNA methylase
MALLRLKKVESLLSGLEEFESPQVELEQYSTPPHLAASFLHSVHYDLHGNTNNPLLILTFGLFKGITPGLFIR